MKKAALCLGVLMAVTGVCFAGDNSVVGTWEVVSVAWTTADGTEGTREAQGRSIKIYTESHFAVVGHNDEGEFSHAFAGEYVLEGDTVTEKLQKGSNPDAVGTETSHKFSISGDEWRSTRVAPNGTEIQEVWKRIE